MAPTLHVTWPLLAEEELASCGLVDNGQLIQGGASVKHVALSDGMPHSVKANIPRDGRAVTTAYRLLSLQSVPPQQV